MQNLIKFSSVFFVRQIFVCGARTKEIGDLFDQNVYGFKNKYVIGMIENASILTEDAGIFYLPKLILHSGIVSRLSEALSAVKFVPDSWKTAFTSLWCCGKVFRDHVTGYALF